MAILIRFSRTCILLLIMSCVVFGVNLTEKQRSKLHPLFQSLITNSSHPLAKMTSKLHRITSTVSSDGTLRYGAIIYTRDVETLRAMGIQVNSVLPEFVTAQLTPSDMTRLADLETVKFLDPGKVHHSMLDVSVPETGAALLHSGFINNTPYKGAGAIVLIFDTGIDWKHFDFRKAGDTTKSRILFIWDQTLTPIAGESSPSGLGYGVEYTQAQIENEFNGSARGIVREKDTFGHGTHVASTAAGNGQAFNNKYIGMAPEADIIIVKGGEGTFSSTGEMDGLTYALNKATALREPIVVNMSLGGQQGPHDGTDPDEVAVDNFVKNPGHVVCIAAGNDGAHAIHINGTISNGLPAVVPVTVPAYTSNPGTENDDFILDIWLSDANAVSMKITTPSNKQYITPADSSIDGLNNNLDGTIDTWNHTETPYNHRHIQMWIHDATAIVPKPGTWTITLTTTGNPVAYDGWINSDLGDGTTSATLTNGNSNKTVSIPGTASGAITVASYVTKWNWTSSDGTSWIYSGPSDRTGNISTFSGIGPTADGRLKPDIAAPGQGIVAAFSGNDVTESASDIIVSNKYLLMQGTSMATPHATGAAALLLGAKPSLTADQIKIYFTSTAKTDAFTSTVWNSSWGFGKLDMYKAMASAVGASGASRATLSYNSDSIAAYTPLTNASGSNQKVAMRFTPTISGSLYSIVVTINGGPSGVRGTGNLKVTATQSVTGSVDGIPGPQIGNSVLVPFSSLISGDTNTIDLSSAGMAVKSGTDFQIVLETTNVGDTLQLLLDDGSLLIDRSSSYRIGVNGPRWYNRLDPNYASGYAPTYYNLLIKANIAATVTDVERISNALPTSFSLKQNYPNPFNPSTNIEYSIPVKGLVKLQIFDILGRSIAILVNTTQEAGVYHTTWDGKAAATGVYFYKLESGNFSKSERMLLLK
jgi:subtilisin family serine protease